MLTQYPEGQDGARARVGVRLAVIAGSTRCDTRAARHEARAQTRSGRAAHPTGARTKPRLRSSANAARPSPRSSGGGRVTSASSTEVCASYA